MLSSGTFTLRSSEIHVFILMPPGFGGHSLRRPSSETRLSHFQEHKRKFPAQMSAQLFKMCIHERKEKRVKCEYNSKVKKTQIRIYRTFFFSL